MSTRRRVLARSGFCRIEQSCGCGRVLELFVGPITLRFDAGSLQQVRDTIDAALRRLEREREDTRLFGGLTDRGQA